MLFFMQASTWRYMAEFQQYETEFTTVKDYVLSCCAGIEETQLFLTFQDPVYELQNIDADSWVDMPQEAAQALKTLEKNAFPCKDADFDRIVIHGDQVAFGISNGAYYLIFAPEGWPQRAYYAKEGEHFWVRIIGNGWYHVAVTG